MALLVALAVCFVAIVAPLVDAYGCPFAKQAESYNFTGDWSFNTSRKSDAQQLVIHVCHKPSGEIFLTQAFNDTPSELIGIGHGNWSATSMVVRGEIFRIDQQNVSRTSFIMGMNTDVHLWWFEDEAHTGSMTHDKKKIDRRQCWIPHGTDERLRYWHDFYVEKRAFHRHQRAIRRIQTRTKRRINQKTKRKSARLSARKRNRVADDLAKLAAKDEEEEEKKEAKESKTENPKSKSSEKSASASILHDLYARFAENVVDPVMRAVGLSSVPDQEGEDVATISNKAYEVISPEEIAQTITKYLTDNNLTHEMVAENATFVSTQEMRFETLIGTQWKYSAVNEDTAQREQTLVQFQSAEQICFTDDDQQIVSLANITQLYYWSAIIGLVESEGEVVGTQFFVRTATDYMLAMMFDYRTNSRAMLQMIRDDVEDSRKLQCGGSCADSPEAKCEL